MRFDAQDLAHVCAVLGNHARVVDALPELAGHFGARVAERTLRDSFARNNLGSPSEYIRGGRRNRPPEPSLAAGGFVRDTEPAHAMRGTMRIVVCPDVHVPYHDELAWRTFLAAVRDVRPDVLVIIGDFADSYCVSSHAKNPERRMNLREELEQVNLALDEIERLRVPRVVFTEGNHETRITRFLCERAPELFGLITVPDLLRIKARGWEWVPYKQWIRIGKMAFTHDIERSGVNAARQTLVDFGANICFGHTHRGAVVYQGTVEGDQRVALNVGWLGSYESIDYRHQAMARRDWQHGFGFIEQDETGVSWCTFVPVLSGRCVVGGRTINGRQVA